MLDKVLANRVFRVILNGYPLDRKSSVYPIKSSILTFNTLDILATKVKLGSTSPFSILNKCLMVIPVFSHRTFCDIFFLFLIDFMFLPNFFLTIVSIANRSLMSSGHICLLIV